MSRSDHLFLLVFLSPALLSCGAGGDHGVATHSFPPHFIFGVGYSAYQAEGNSPNNDYDVWNREGNGEDLNGLAANSYVLYDLDAELARKIGAGAVRMGIEWARVEPERDAWDEEEIGHYREVILSISKRGMRPYVTLWHFTNPLWLAEAGRWESRNVVREFAEYAAEMARRYGDLVDDWITLNEPGAYAAGTYLANVFPGGSYLDTGKLASVMVNLTLAHAAAYDAIKEDDEVDADGDGKASVITFVNATSPYVPADPNSATSIEAAKSYDYVMNRAVLEAVVHGHLDANLDGASTDLDTDPPEGFRADLAGRLDYVGINYYSRSAVIHLPGMPGPLKGVPCVNVLSALCPGAPEGVERGTNGNEVYPAGIHEVVAEMARYGLPMMVTENGVATPDGTFRARYIISHLRELLRAIRDGYDVRGYLHWSLIDNFEWVEGFKQRFGLYTVDYATFERQLNEGGEVFGRIASERAIPDDLFTQYGIDQ